MDDNNSSGSEPPKAPGPLAEKAISVTGVPQHGAERLPPGGLALTSKFALDKNGNIVVLSMAVTSSQTKSGFPELVKTETKSAEEEVRVAKPAKPEHDPEVANNNTTATITYPQEPKADDDKSDQDNNNEKSVNMPAPLADNDAAVMVRSGEAAKQPPAGTREKWALIWKLLESSRDMVKDKANYEQFRTVLASTMGLASPVASKGPVCANPVCGSFGHTLAVCPIPTDPEHGDISGCFFCNVVEHDADDCPMMEWVSPATLVTHLITNRAGMPPWNTRIDWVALALSEWDLVCFTMLPLTRAFVKKVYIPGRRWKEVDGVSPITDPAFKNADRKLLKDLARKPTKPKPGDSRSSRRPLMEASLDMCYCRNKCHDDAEHTVFKNEAVQKFIPNMSVDEETYQRLMAAYEREVASNQLQVPKKVPKNVTKERKGRRAMKKEAMAAAAAAGEGQEAVTAGPSVPKSTTTAMAESIDHAERDDSSEDEDGQDVPVSQSLLDLADAVDEVIKNIQKVVKS